MVYGFHINVLYAFGSQWHSLLEAVPNVYFHVYAPILEWGAETFFYSSLHPLYLASSRYLVSLLNELGLVYG